MCSVWVELDDTDIFDVWRAEGDCGWVGPDREDKTYEGRYQADRDANSHDSQCEK